MKDSFNTYRNKAYRFLSFEGLTKTVESGYLRFARPDTFNDPLDVSPYLLDFDWENYSQTDQQYRPSNYDVIPLCII